jgi:hypothetical protein
MKKKILIIPLLCLALLSQAQQTHPTINRKHFVGFGFALGTVSVKDEINTSLPYIGVNMASLFDVHLCFKKSNLTISNISSTGNLVPYGLEKNNGNSASNTYSNFKMNYQFLAFTSESFKTLLFVGPELLAKVGLRQNQGKVGNSSRTYEGIGSLALSINAEKYFNIFKSENDIPGNNDFKIGAYVSLPLISKVFTPSYIGFPENILSENVTLLDLKSNYTGYVWNYFNVEMGVSLTYYLKNRNGIEVSYFSDFISTKPTYNPSKSKYQFISIKLLYNLN